MATTDRATCWSITINNPTESDYLSVELPAGWKLTGQLEEGQEGTQHYQGMLTTPQTRFSAVKKVFPRAHIEVARNRAALQKYVHKDDTRVGDVADRQSDIPTLWHYQTMVAAKWDNDEFSEYAGKNMLRGIDFGESALLYVDSLVAKDIESGMRGVEFIAINPMWRSSWKKFWYSIIKRRDGANVRTEVCAATEGEQESLPASCSGGDETGSGNNDTHSAGS